MNRVCDAVYGGGGQGVAGGGEEALKGHHTGKLVASKSHSPVKHGSYGVVSALPGLGCPRSGG